MTARTGTAAAEVAGNEVRHADGRVELVETARIEQSPLYNPDLAPVPVSRRKWTTYNYAALWIAWPTASPPTCWPPGSWPRA